MSASPRLPDRHHDGRPPAARKPRARRLPILVGLTAVGLVSAGAAWAYPHLRAERLWRHAREALADDDPARAQSLLQNYLVAHPEQPEAHFLLARACRRQGDFAAARTHLQRAAQLGQSAADLDLERQLLLAQVGAIGEASGDLIAQFQAGHYEEELILEALVTGYLKADRLHDATDWATVWLDRYPDHWQPWLYRGRALQLRWLLDVAVPDFRRALELRPGQPQACLWLAGCLASNGRFADALGHYQTYLQGQPGEPQGLIGSAYCQLALNDVAGARAAVDAALDREPQNPAALLLRGQVALRDERPQEALAWLRRAEAASPHETDTITSLIAALRRLGQDREADRYEARLNESRQQLQKLDDLARRLSSGPGDNRAALRHEGAMILMSLGRADEAVRWLEAALQDDPGHAPSHRALADHYDRQGDRARAAAHRRRAAAPDGPGRGPP
jgi:tetratricopeptide (TPR) repeat protein